MRAIIQDSYGSADVLRLADLPTPAIGPDDVLLRVHAASVHIGDWHLMTGTPLAVRAVGLRAPRARVRGMDVAGTVAAVGARVADLRPGDAVYGVCDGAFAEYARAKPQKLAPLPASLTFAQASAIPTSACTALQALRDAGKVRAGQRVLLVGASGGVGLFATQLAKSFGADVTGVCGPTKAELVRAAGADHVIDYTRGDFLGGEARYDLLLDLGGSYPLARLRRALTPRETLVVVGAEGGGRLLGGTTRSLHALVLAPFASQRLRPLAATTTAADLRFLNDRVAAGELTPFIDRTYTLPETPDALRHLETGSVRGKLVIAIHNADQHATAAPR